MYKLIFVIKTQSLTDSWLTTKIIRENSRRGFLTRCWQIGLDFPCQAFLSCLLSYIKPCFCQVLFLQHNVRPPTGISWVCCAIITFSDLLNRVIKRSWLIRKEEKEKGLGVKKFRRNIWADIFFLRWFGIFGKRSKVSLA